MRSGGAGWQGGFGSAPRSPAEHPRSASGPLCRHKRLRLAKARAYRLDMNFFGHPPYLAICPTAAKFLCITSIRADLLVSVAIRPLLILRKTRAIPGLGIGLTCPPFYWKHPLRGVFIRHSQTPGGQLAADIFKRSMPQQAVRMRDDGTQPLFLLFALRDIAIKDREAVRGRIDLHLKPFQESDGVVFELVRRLSAGSLMRPREEKAFLTVGERLPDHIAEQTVSGHRD